MADVHLLIGSNQGDRLQNIGTAKDLITEHLGQIIGTSQVYLTQPWGFECTELFHNQAILIETQLNPSELLRKIHFIEEKMGRVLSKPGEPFTSRVIDIDIIFYEDLVINHAPELIIPHPRMQDRRFVLEPLSQLSPDKIHPLKQKTSRELLQECKDDNFVIRL